MAKDKKTYMREYMRKYAMRRYYAKKQALIDKLGGKCAVCGSTDRLEFDHVKHGSRAFTITSKVWWAKSEAVASELAKCQLLCHACHMLKSIQEKGHTPASGTHGTLAAYRYCKCEECREANKRYCREYRQRVGRTSKAAKEV